MATAFYCIAAGTTDESITQATRDRAVALSCTLIKGDPSGLVTVFPSVVVTSTALAAVVIADDTGQATLTEVQTAQTNATNAEKTKATNIANANVNLQTLITQLTPGLAQAQTDIQTLASSSDPNAPIISRCVQGVVTLAHAVQDALVYLEIISG